MSGIISYGSYIPTHKIETGEIAAVWGADGRSWAKNLNVYSKSVPENIGTRSLFDFLS